ncbi:AbrB/MazE/SpoVT family DNA-binding domain-containing protein [Devosia sp. RR2S18]|uniref:AbrB/MazE/SpoVT family DNA-binding domain-containing protein n=1 Tax=Devosia rhizosphaerae TaxID=3049774 RepID=UPI002540B103|nr:AbrB/MazE/SpoVT family DNA-binding domain-containing protein [Devosia sp. RR2S18]WIJ24854.1 AbrB/MazE/SpoVT family DNA-binding domain-containing protein [Devosia sp. RR2S18]
METAVKKIGNSAGVVIPKPMLQEIGAGAGDKVDLSVVDGKIVIEPLRKSVREGWAEDAARLAALGDDELVWPEFANDADEDWTW